MPELAANGISLTYEVSGSGDPLLLIMGLGGQLTDWHPEFIEALSEHFTVIRYDNRDSGLSTYSDAPPPSRWELLKMSLLPKSVTPPYTLGDMADDAAALLDALCVEAAHVVGMSMGGMIAQQLAVRHPSKARSLCSIMSNTGDLRAGRPSPRVLAALARRGRPGRAETLEATLELFALVGGRDWDADEQRRRSAASIERAYNPDGVLRQTTAIATAANRTAALGLVNQPTLVIHGLDDTLVRPSGGVATAKAVPHSRLIMYPRMGHDLPVTRHREMVQAILENAALAGDPSVLS